MSGSYFETPDGDAGVPTAKGRFVEVDAIDPVEFAPGLVFRPILGERVLVNFVRFDTGTEAPVHSHDEEQVAYVLEGEFEFELDGEVRVMRPGDLVHIPPFVPHGARTRDSSCFEMDVFSPPRRALVEAAGLEAAAGPSPAEP